MDELYDLWDRDYQRGINSSMKILGPENGNEAGMFTEYYWMMPVDKYVEEYGLDDCDRSMNTL